MTKKAQGKSRKSAGARQRPATGIHGQSANWEKRLTEARLQRQRLLAARKPATAVRPTAGEDGASSEAAKKEAPRNAAETRTGGVSEPPGRGIRDVWRRAQAASAGRLALVAAAGFGVGLLVGIGVMLATGTLPRGSATIVAGAETDGDRDRQLTLAASTDPATKPPDPILAVTTRPLPTVVTDPTLAAVSPLPTGATDPTPAAESRVPPRSTTTAVTTGTRPETPAGTSEDAAPAIPDAVSSMVFIPPDTETVPVTIPPVSALQHLGSGQEATKTVPPLPGPDDISGLPGGLTGVGDGGKSLRFYMHVPDGVSRSTLRRFVRRLDAHGVTVAQIGRESFRVSTTHLRFYSSETAAVARSVAAGLGVEARDFTNERLNRERIEIWLAGRPRARETEEEAPDPRPGMSILLRDKLSANR